MSLGTSPETVRTLQTALQTKAKAEPTVRFYSLWDKVCRRDVLAEAYRRCRANRGAAGSDGERFEDIEALGRSAWLEGVRQELLAQQYQPQPLLRVWIPKASGGQRPLGIPTIRDRVVQMAVLLVIGPIFDVDLSPRQFGFRPGRNAKMALRCIHFAIAHRGAREVVDADLSDYFNTIPHGDLMRCVARRISDGTVLSVIRQWLDTSVLERTPQGDRYSAEARRRHRGTPQGGIISPLLANLYFRRFLLAWSRFGYADKLRAEVVNYADDFVILCPPGRGAKALAAMQHLMGKLGLTVNEKKTRLAVLPADRFDFLGYTVGRFFGKGGHSYWGTAVSKKAIQRVTREIHDATTSRWSGKSVQSRIDEINPLLRGWAGYFDQGPVTKVYRHVQDYANRRLRLWLMRKRGRKGTGYRQYSDQFLYETLGLIRLVPPRLNLSNAKV
ncbi:MAG: group II intron reverse transcriptase/maturase [Rhodanobacteraceae bacterium]|nr:group II intron reverse transcriptase/maturase [Rhodanobacteraceae bacterium]